MLWRQLDFISAILLRFRAGFRHAFAWCPFIKVSEEDKMELQHTNTFRVTMTRSHRSDTHPRASIKTNIEKDICLQRKKQKCSTQNAQLVKKLSDKIPTHDKLMEHSLWLRSGGVMRAWKGGEVTSEAALQTEGTNNYRIVYKKKLGWMCLKHILYFNLLKKK